MGIICRADFSPRFYRSQPAKGGLKSALQQGFTLIELLIVIVVIAMTAAVVAPNIGSGNQTATLSGAARELASALRFARGYALSRHKESSLLLNLDDNSYKISGKKKLYKLSKDIEVTLEIAESELIDEKQGGFRFFADGSSTGGRITLEIADNKRQIDVNWLTGQVEIDDGQDE